MQPGYFFFRLLADSQRCYELVHSDVRNTYKMSLLKVKWAGGVSVSLLEWYLKGKYINKWMKGSLCTWQEIRGNISSFIWETATTPGLEKLMTLSWICTEYMTSLILWLHGFNYIGCFVTVYPKLLASFLFWFTKKHNFKNPILSTQCKKYFSFSLWQDQKLKFKYEMWVMRLEVVTSAWLSSERKGINFYYPLRRSALSQHQKRGFGQSWRGHPCQEFTNILLAVQAPL